MRIALAQFNPIVGDLSGNTAKIIQLAAEASSSGADILITPELALSGYSPEDLLLRDSFYQQVQIALDQLLEIDGITIIVGHPVKLGVECFNAATVMRDGNRLGQYQKMSLPNNSVFDECRYFSPGYSPLVFEQNGVKVGLLICEDIWDVDPASAVLDAGAEVILALNASPFHQNKQQARYKELAYRVEETNLPIAYVNMVGAQDELVFDGGSFALNRSGKLVAQAACFADELLLVDFIDKDLQPAKLHPVPDILEGTYTALVCAVRDYVRKNAFPGVVLGMSGGIDSALTLAIACDALGADKVSAVMMPSPYTAQISLDDAQQMTYMLGVSYQKINIWPVFQQFSSALSAAFNGMNEDVTEENIQARIRGTLLMALSNKNGSLVLTTGNKSELTTGYCTLYGDMAGGFAVLKDVAKTLVYQLAIWRNKKNKIIPERIITRAPSAELSAGQTDQDTLPPYDVLDSIMQLYVEQNCSIEQIISKGFYPDDVSKVINLLIRNEYKRRQAPIGPRITQRAFGKDWRYPIINYFR